MTSAITTEMRAALAEVTDPGERYDAARIAVAEVVESSPSWGAEVAA